MLTPRPIKPPRHSLGFTLMEMMVVVVILLILAAFGFPALQQLLNRSKLQGAAREIAVHLGSSRITALRLGRNVVVKPMFAEKRLVSFVDDNENFVQDLGEDELSSLSLVGLGGDRGIFLMGPDGVVGTDDDPGRRSTGSPPSSPATPTFPTSTSRSSSPTARSATTAASASRTARTRRTCSRCASTRRPLQGSRS